MSVPAPESVTPTTYISSASESSWTINYPTGLKAGDLLVMVIFCNVGSANFPTLSGWTLTRNDTANGVTAGWYYRWVSNPSSIPASLTYSSSTSAKWSACMDAYTGLVFGATPQAGGIGTGAATPYTAPAITTTQPNDLILTMGGCLTSLGSFTLTPPTGETQHAAVQSAVQKQASWINYEVQAAIGGSGTKSEAVTNGTAGIIYITHFYAQSEIVLTGGFRPDRFRWEKRRPQRRSRRPKYLNLLTSSPSGPEIVTQRRQRRPRVRMVKARPQPRRYDDAPGILPGQAKALLAAALTLEQFGASAATLEAYSGQPALLESLPAVASCQESQSGLAVLTEALTATAADVQSTRATP